MLFRMDLDLQTVAMKRYTDLVGNNGDGERLVIITLIIVLYVCIYSMYVCMYIACTYVLYVYLLG